jgi:hypothetical protein
VSSNEREARWRSLPARVGRALGAGAIITGVQVGLLYASMNLALLLFGGPILGWTLATWVLGTWHHTKVRYAWPIGLANLTWIFFAHGFEDGFGDRGPAIGLGVLAILTFFVSGLCFFGRDNVALQSRATDGA